MSQATLLIKVIPTKLREALKSIKEISGVKDAFIVYGRFDLVVSIGAINYEEMIRLTAEINKIEGIRSTETLLEA
ncbi:MAG: Lrp/AsnC ligand binding domain-containing protein [Thaumarchaeota archaeon]|nr:Lrp/AsnC ligand binding domain-containing protein [Nitrososphaerota archaeon]